MPAQVFPYHLAQLAALCDAQPLGRKVVFVPSRQIGHNVGNALSSFGRSWANLYLTTPLDWAERLAGSRLRSAGWRPLVQDADLFFLQSQVREIKWPQGHPFAEGFALDGVARAFLKTLRALRGAGIDARDIGQADLRNGSILADLFGIYCNWMAENRLYDGAKMLSEAAKAASRENNALVAIFDEVPLPRPALEFIEAISDGEVLRIGRDEYDAPLPQHCAGRRFAGAPLVEAVNGRVHPSARFAGTSSPVGIELREAVGIENEVRGMLRELLIEEAPLDSVEIAYATEEPYLPLLVDIADRFELPMTSSAGVPVTCTSTGQALIGFYGWIAGGFDPADLVRLCRSRLLDPRTHISSEDVGRIVEEARIGRGHRAHATALQRMDDRLSARLQEENGSESEGVGHRLETVRRARSVLDHLSDVCPSAGTASLNEMCHAGARFLQELAPSRRSERDARAAESLRDRLLELADSAEAEGRASQLSKTLVDLISEHKVEASVAKPGHLYVVPLQRAGYSGRDRIVVVGMAESSFPGVATEDPILLDEERRSLSDDLVLERSRSSDMTWHLIRALGMASSRVLLVSNRQTIADGRETYPSAVFQELAAQLDEEVATYHPTPEPGAAIDESELILAVRHSSNVVETLESERPWLACGLEAQRERSDRALGRFDGWIGRTAPELRPGGSDVLSASRLEDLAACPYRYFLKYVLDIRPPDVQEDIPGHWLTPLEFGSLLHRILRVFMETVAERGERVNVGRHETLLADILQRNVDRMRERVPVIHESGYRVDVNRLRRAARIFLNEESRRNVDPVGFEVSFGLGESDGLSRPEPVVIDLSESVRISLRGSIDRIDRSADGYEVWDYKTGSTYDFDEYDLLMRGRRLQWALYAFVLEQLLEDARLEGRVLRSGYFFTSDREHGLRLAQEPPRREELAGRIEPLFDLVAEGGFVHVQKSKACTYCDYKVVCASERRDDRDMDEIRKATPEARTFMRPLERWMSD